MGWLPSAPQLNVNPLGIKAQADAVGASPVDYTVQALQSGDIRFACEQPDSGGNHPRNLFVWRSNLLGSSGKGHEYMLKYLLGTDSGIQGEALGDADVKPEEVEWQQAAIEGKLDLLVTLDFRMGVDAWQLANHFSEMRQLPGFQLSGATGALTASSNCVINRKLPWLQYRQGQIVPAS